MTVMVPAWALFGLGCSRLFGTGTGTGSLTLNPAVRNWQPLKQTPRVPASGRVTVVATVNHVTDAMTVTRDRDRRQPCYGDVCRAAVVGLSRQDSGQLGLSLGGHWLGL
jgi:hypothetical protein